MTTSSKILIIIDSNIPEINMTSPLINAAYKEGETIPFNATATDYEDGVLVGNSLKWYSDNTEIGTGTNFTLNNLAIGTHSIKLNATDSHGIIKSVTRTLLIIGTGNATINTFKDQNAAQNNTYTNRQTKTLYVRIPKGANITSATLQIERIKNE